MGNEGLHRDRAGIMENGSYLGVRENMEKKNVENDMETTIPGG